MSDLQVSGFGKLKLKSNTIIIKEFPTRHAEALLGYLLLNQHVEHNRCALIDLLWPYDTPENGRGCLSTVLWRLRCLFRKLNLDDCSFIQTTRDYVVFSPKKNLLFDVGCFNKLTKKINTSSQKDVETKPLIEAINIYQGDLYTGIDADWCLIERERLESKYLQILGKIMHYYIQEQAFSEAIDIGKTILNKDSLREEVHRALIYCYSCLGQRAQVAAQFQQCSKNLLNELQVLPMPETVKLYQQTMISLVNQNLNHPHQVLVEQAQLAFTEFQQSGEQLHTALLALENKNPISAISFI